VSGLLRVLIVEDSTTDAKLIAEELRRAGLTLESQRVETPEEMRGALARQTWDLVTADWSMPKFTAPAALGILKETQLDVPFIIVSGTIGEDTAVEAMRAGAHDYLLKDRLTRLVPAVERALRECRERAALRQTEIALRVSEAHLREALRARDEFLAIASHELKTPLTSLSLQVASARQLLEERDAPVPVERVEAKLVRASFLIIRLTAMINNFLSVTRINSGRMVLSPETFELHDVVDTVLAGAHEQLARSGSTLDVRSGPSVVGTWDHLALESAMFNLVSNAIKYGQGNPITLDVGVQAGHARLVVTDHGIGMSTEVQERIFRRFERAVPKEHFGGLGLGLWVAREIIEAHGGSIGVESERGIGSTFTVLLPLTRHEWRAQ
jgi:signal transduction histidine kinase